MTKFLCAIGLLLLSCGVVEAKIEIGDGPPGNVTALEIWADQKAKNKQVVIPYADFLVMLSKVEHSEKLKNKAMAENGVMVKLNDEHKTIIKIQADQIQACEAIVKSHERLGETQEQISKAVEQKLAELTQSLEHEKSKHKWYAITGIGVGVVIGLVIMVVVN